MSIAPYDIKLNGLKYNIVPATYDEFSIQAVKPAATRGGDPEARNNSKPAWAWWSMSYFMGMDVPDWKVDGGFYRALGISLANEGQCAAAYGLTNVLSDTVNVDGYLFIDFGNGHYLAIGKTDGKAFTSTTLASWTTIGYISAAGTALAANSWAIYKGVLIVTMSNGTCRTSADYGATWAAFAALTPPNGNSCYVLGTYRSKLYIAWNNDLRTWDGTTLVALAVLDGTPTCAAVGNGSMFILAQGQPAHMYMAQLDQVVELLQWPGAFQPDDCIYTDTLYISGGALDLSGGYDGQLWKYGTNGLELVFDFPTDIYSAGTDLRIRSLAGVDQQVLFSWNKGAGIGHYDPTLDFLPDPSLGTWLGEKTAANTAGAGKVIGILPVADQTAIGIAGLGIYKTSGFADWELITSLFGSTSKRVGKLWGEVELTHEALQTGQSFTVYYSINGGATWTSLGVSNTVGGTKAYLDFPNLNSPVMQLKIVAVAAGADITLLDLSASFIEASANPKRQWNFTIVLEGSDAQPMQFRDGTDFDRSSVTMKHDLDALWNTRFAFEDIFGDTRTVMMPSPHFRVNDIPEKQLNEGDLSTVESVLATYNVHLVEV